MTLEVDRSQPFLTAHAASCPDFRHVCVAILRAQGSSQRGMWLFPRLCAQPSQATVSLFPSACATEPIDRSCVLIMLFGAGDRSGWVIYICKCCLGRSGGHVNVESCMVQRFSILKIHCYYYPEFHADAMIYIIGLSDHANNCLTA